MDQLQIVGRELVLAGGLAYFSTMVAGASVSVTQGVVGQSLSFFLIQSVFAGWFSIEFLVYDNIRRRITPTQALVLTLTAIAQFAGMLVGVFAAKVQLDALYNRLNTMAATGSWRFAPIPSLAGGLDDMVWPGLIFYVIVGVIEYCLIMSKARAVVYGVGAALMMPIHRSIPITQWLAEIVVFDQSTTLLSWQRALLIFGGRIISFLVAWTLQWWSTPTKNSQ